ncbi:MAG: CoA-binding protein [bacterium]|jgi:predicted CoA-binding protein|nr:CoA-binding protein [candidate division KSB1 bacterium]MDH7560830.1 CoA-binding protein [bacterium]
MSEATKTVVVVGASPKRERYSNRAVRLLLEHGYRVVPVHPVQREIEGLRAVADLTQVEPPVHTVTMYVACEKSRQSGPAIIALQPARVIFNPGAECPELEQELADHGILCVRACTLLLLRCGEF